jgi:hypothetical protein
MERATTRQSKTDRALARIPGLAQNQEGKDADEVFGVKHLTNSDIMQVEEALNAMDLEEMVATVDAIVGRHQRKTSVNRKDGES